MLEPAYSWSTQLISRLLGLNVNKGQRIDIRLRSPNDESIFLPYDDLLGTLLHE